MGPKCAFSGRLRCESDTLPSLRRYFFLSSIRQPVRMRAVWGGALQEARLVSSYYQFARHCESVGAITEGELAEFRQRLLGAVFEKYGLDVDEDARLFVSSRAIRSR